MTNEFEREGVPTVLISNLRSVAELMRVNRYLAGVAIPHLLGDPTLPLDEEQRLRRNLVSQALTLLQTPADELVGARSATILDPDP